MPDRCGLLDFTLRILMRLWLHNGHSMLLVLLLRLLAVRWLSLWLPSLALELLPTLLLMGVILTLLLRHRPQMVLLLLALQLRCR